MRWIVELSKFERKQEMEKTLGCGRLGDEKGMEVIRIGLLDKLRAQDCHNLSPVRWIPSRLWGVVGTDTVDAGNLLSTCSLAAQGLPWCSTSSRASK